MPSSALGTMSLSRNADCYWQLHDTRTTRCSMDAISRAHSHYGTSLVLRGILLLLAGFTGLAWPEATLLFSALAATITLAMFGLYDIVLGVRSRKLSRGWPLPVATGIVCLTFATLSLMVPGMVLHVA